MAQEKRTITREYARGFYAMLVLLERLYHTSEGLSGRDVFRELASRIKKLEPKHWDVINRRADKYMAEDLEELRVKREQERGHGAQK